MLGSIPTSAPSLGDLERSSLNSRSWNCPFLDLDDALTKFDRCCTPSSDDVIVDARADEAVDMLANVPRDEVEATSKSDAIAGVPYG